MREKRIMPAAGLRMRGLMPISAQMIARPHQVAASRAILAARAAGRPGFLLGDTTGLGKTLSVWGAVAAMPEREVLIVCPKGAMPCWARALGRIWP